MMDHPKLETAASGDEGMSTVHPSAAGGFGRSPFAQNVLPWITSLALHAGLLVLALLAARVLIYTVTVQRVEQITPASGSLVTDLPGLDLSSAGRNHDDLLHKLAQDAEPNPQQLGLSDHKGLTAALTAPGGGADQGEAVAMIGLGSMAGGGGGVGLGKGDRSGADTGEDGLAAQFGHPGSGSGYGPGDGIFGRSSGIRRMAFVCDGSGSMISKMASLKNELAKTIDSLTPIQSFNVIFFSGEKYAAFSTSQLLGANPGNRRKAHAFLENVTSGGTTNPIPGLELAFSEHPQVIYLLTDGDFPDNTAVLQRINELNKDKKVRINTIAFVADSDRDVDFMELLQRIAHENGGTYKFVRESDLNP